MAHETSYVIQGFLRQPTKEAARRYLGIGEGSDDAGTVTEADLNLSDITTANSTAAQHGLLPKLSGNSTDVLKGDGTFGGIAGGGDVTGPASSTDSHVALFNGATGKIIKDTGIASTQIPTAGENDALVGTNGVPSAANPFVTDSDPRNTNARTPSGAAGGVLSGTYPSPGFAVDMATQAELDAVGTVVLDHSARHENGGADEMNVAGLGGVLADPQTPAAHAATHSNASSDPVTITNLAGFPGGTATFLRADATFAAPPAGGAGNVGTATLNFGAFPGASDTSLAITGQSGIVAGSVVDAWIRPVATAEHSADEHWVESVKIVAGNIVAGVGFTIYGRTQDKVRLYGNWSVAWNWS